ncbi:MAG TPA: uracil-DNA glycosylase family protein [Candidatus Acidoferrum sp.]|nr:uracil-DNA glycosylase family protein [Candidatus Acidoferrum sp.]
METVYAGAVIIYTYRKSRRLFLFLDREEGWLDMTKGHVDGNEEVRETAIREAREESGLSVVPDSHFKDYMKYDVMEKGKKKHKVVTVFLAKVPPSSKVTISPEHVGYEWLTVKEAMGRFRREHLLTVLQSADKYIDRVEEMEKLNREYSKLPVRFKGWNLSKRLVPGDGPLNARVMIVGQAPGRKEDELLKPFVGISGKLLTKLIERAGLKREEVYITSTVQFFPPKNRIPTDEEIDACRTFLKRQIAIIKPKVIVVVGAVATKELLGMKEVMKLHGRLIKKDYNYFITLHPAAAVRIKKNMPLIEKDFRKLKAVLIKL